MTGASQPVLKMIQRRVFVSGRVQGVGFRYSTRTMAARHSGLRGFVRNLDDGRVEAVFCGPQREVLEMVAWCRQGPRHAQVTELEVIEEEPDSGLSGFGMEPGGD